MAVLTQPVSAKRRRTDLAVIDCDIHNATPSPSAYSRYLPERWRRYHETFGQRGVPGASYPRMNLSAARSDSWPPSGLPPGADLSFLQYQLLDTWNMEYGVLNPLGGAGSQLNLEYAAALSSAANDWQIAEWLEPEPRLRASIVIPQNDGEMSAKEIHRAAQHPGFVQALVVARTPQLLGHRTYWKIYEALSEHNLPLGIHFGGSAGFPITGAGWPSFYYEDHAGMPPALETQVVSLVFEGVFEQFPTLKIVLIEGGFAWLPSLMWRMDRAWQRLHEEVPHLKEPPSHYVRRHFWVTTQPMEEPTRKGDFHRLLEHMNMDDRLMFATDYPHWDFDAPDEAVPVKLEDDLEKAIMAENARALYRLQ